PLLLRLAKHRAATSQGSRVVALGHAPVTVAAVIDNDQLHVGTPRHRTVNLTRAVGACIAGAADHGFTHGLVFAVRLQAGLKTFSLVHEGLSGFGAALVVGWGVLSGPGEACLVVIEDRILAIFAIQRQHWIQAIGG